MTISRQTAVLLAILIILTAMPLAAWHGGNARIKPAESGESLRLYYLGQAILGLPESFRLETGRLRLVCEGNMDMTAMAEVPHRGGPLSFEAMNALIPESGRHYPVKDLSAEMNRPAHLFYTNPGPTGVLATIIVDYGPGALRLSRQVKRDLTGNFAVEDFENDAGRYARNYFWGHNGARTGDMHSLYGRVSAEQGCREYRARLKFSSPDHSIKVMLVNDQARDLEALAADYKMDLALHGDALHNPPTWLSEMASLKTGQWNRKVRGGPRKVAGRPGLEWVTLRHNLLSGQKTLAAIWLPDSNTQTGQPPIPVLIMSSAHHEAAKAMSYWDDLLNSSVVISDN